MYNKNKPYIIELKDLVVELISPLSLRSKETAYINREEENSPSIEQRISSLMDDQISAIVETWLFLANSIMSGEFLSHAEYFQTLDEIIKTIRQAYDKNLNASADGDLLNNPPHLHPVLVAIHDLCFELRSKCRLMYIQIKLEKEKGNTLTTLPPLPPQWNNSGKKDEEIKNLVEWLRQLVKGLIEMTVIDFTCHINKTKLKSLHILFDACEQTKRVTELRGETLYNPFTINPSPQTLKNIPYGIPLLEAIRCKCSVVAYQSIFKAKEQTGQGLSISYNSEKLVWVKQCEESPHRPANKDLYPDNIGDPVEASENEDRKSLFHFWKSRLRHYGDKINLPYSEPVILYNLYIKASINKRQDYTKAIAQIHSINKKHNDGQTDIQNINDIISHHFANNGGHIDLPLDFILTSMHAIEQAEIKLDDYKDSHTRINLLRKLLLHFNDLKTKYEHINQPYEQTRLFEESFFTCDTSHPTPFFVASLDCRYIDSDHLEELDIYYNRLLHQYRLEESDTLIADIKQDYTKALEAERERNAVALKEQQRDYLTLLGIFAALITLSVSLVESFKLAETIWDYMAMLGGAYVLIGLLVIVLYLRNTNKEEGQSTIATMNKSMVIAVCLGILGIGVKGCKEIFPQDTKHESHPTAVSPTTVNQVHIGIPKNEASIDPSQGKTTKRQTDTVAQ